MGEDAAKYALRKLTRRFYSREAMRQILSDQGYEDGSVRDALARLEDLGYIDDLRLARDMVRQYTGRQPKGRLWIEAKLKQDGFCGPVIDQALEAYPADLEKEQAAAAARSYLKTRGGAIPDERKKSAALARFLKSRGFPGPLIHAIMNEFTDEFECLDASYLDRDTNWH
jgi:regulatory protein